MGRIIGHGARMIPGVRHTGELVLEDTGVLPLPEAVAESDDISPVVRVPELIVPVFVDEV
jgi:hypothetical protein